ncbi:MAG TPA: hypothetical protein VK171_01865 [Fimbriimonas sp.]|nr:hypothetical protein [Fimbriimonas sp.]
MSTKEPTIYWLDAVIGVLMTLAGLKLLGLVGTGGNLAGAIVLLAGVSTIFRWAPGMWLGCGIGFLLAIVSLGLLLVSPGYKVSSGQPYPPIFFIIAAILVGVIAAICLYPLWRKKIRNAPAARGGRLP